MLGLQALNSDISKGSYVTPVSGGRWIGLVEDVMTFLLHADDTAVELGRYYRVVRSDEVNKLYTRDELLLVRDPC